MAKPSDRPRRSRVRGPGGPGKYPCQVVFGTTTEQHDRIEALVKRYDGRLSRSEVMRAIVASAFDGDVSSRLEAMVEAQTASGS